MIKRLSTYGFINIGTERLEHVESSKVQITNLVAIVTSILALLYALYFWVALNQITLAIVNLAFVASYAFGLLFTYNRYFRLAKVWFFTVLMAHVYMLNMYVFGVSAGFHFYYLIITPGVFLLFNENDRLEKLAFTLAAGILFFLCHLGSTTEPLVPLSAQSEQLLFLSVIYVTMLETYFIMALLSRNIDTYEKELKAMASTDVLTGINNRRMFMVIGEELFENAKRYHHPLSLLILDIDFFKKINDVFGHLAGDQALKQLAQTLKSNIRSSDLLARYGGEEFVIILPETNLEGATAIAENLRKIVNEMQIDIDQNKPLNITTSIGVAERTANVACIMQLLNNADTALYQAKETGRNKVVAFQEGEKMAG